MSADKTPAAIRRYLLGRSPDSEASSLEEQYFQDEAVLHLVESIEHEMIEAYLDGVMQAAEREPFERHYLASPLHRDRLTAIRALRRPVEPATRAAASARQRWPALLPLAAAIVLVAGAFVWLARGSNSTSPVPTGIPQAQRQPEEPRTGPPEPAVTPAPSGNRPSPAAPVTVAFTVPLIVTRNSDDATLRIPPGTTEVLLRFEGQPPAAAAAIRVDVRTVDGREVWAGAGERAGRGLLAAVRVPASRLPPDDYIVIVEAGPASPPERYSLRVRSNEPVSSSRGSGAPPRHATSSTWR